MSKKNVTLYINAIRNIRPDTTNITVPNISGSHGNVFIADTNDGKLVFKSNRIQMIQKNVLASGMMKRLDIPAPDLATTKSIGRYKKQYFEVYPYVHDKTLYEHIGNGMKSEIIQKSFFEMADILAKMSKFPVDQYNALRYTHAHQITSANISDTTNLIMGKFYQAAVIMLNIGKQYVMHFDMTPKNTVVNDRGEIQHVLDLDAVGICSENFALAAMVSKYQQLGFNLPEILEYYEQNVRRKIQYRTIIRQANLNNIGKHLHWVVGHKKQGSK